MSKQLATAVHMTDEHGIVHSFLPGQTPPKWAIDRIDNPKAWVAVEEDAHQDVSEDTSDDSAAEPEEPVTAGSGIPRKNGSAAAWRAYADDYGFEVDEDVSRTDIIAVLKANGIPTE